MSHGADRSIKIFEVLFLLTNLSCKVLYGGDDKINETKPLYPTATYHHKGSNFQFVNKIEKSNCSKTLFVTIEIQNPASSNGVIRDCADKLNKGFREQFKGMITSKSKAHILSIPINLANVNEVTKKKLLEEINGIKDKIIEKKYENIFTNVVVNVVYAGAMRAVSQNIIRELTNQPNVNEICFDPSEVIIDSDKEIFVDKNWPNEHVENFYTGRDNDLFPQLANYFIHKDNKKFENLTGKVDEDFVSELKRIDPTQQDADVDMVLQFLSQNGNDKLICHIGKNLESLRIISIEKVVEEIVSNCFSE